MKRGTQQRNLGLVLLLVDANPPKRATSGASYADHRTVRNLLTHNKIPSLDTLQMSDLLHYLFTTSEKPERIQVAEAVYRYDTAIRAHWMYFLPARFPWLRRPRAVGAQGVHLPSDWQLELMYDGAVARRLPCFSATLPWRRGTMLSTLSTSCTGVGSVR